MYASHWKKILCGTHKIFSFIRFEITWTSRINLKLVWGYDIKYLSISAFIGNPCFPTRKVSKVTFIIFQLKKKPRFISWLFFWQKRTSWDLFGWKTRIIHKSSNAWIFNVISPKNFRFIWLVHAISKRINGIVLSVPHIIFFSVACIYQVWMVFARIGNGLCFCHLKLNLHSVVCLAISYQSFQFSSNSSSTSWNL